MDNRCVLISHARCLIVKIVGEVDLSWSADIRKLILDAVGKSPISVVDLSEVGYIDSSGIAALVEGLQTAKSQQKKFALLAASQPVCAVLELARLDKVFNLIDDLESLA